MLDDLIMDLLMILVGVQIGAPYKTIGLMSESNSVMSALNDSLGDTAVYSYSTLYYSTILLWKYRQFGGFIHSA